MVSPFQVVYKGQNYEHLRMVVSNDLHDQDVVFLNVQQYEHGIYQDHWLNYVHCEHYYESQQPSSFK